MDISTPLKPAILHILLALATEDRHGYGIMQAVREQSRGTVPLRTGSFYRHLSNLIDAGWVVEAEGRPEHDDPRRGAYYRLTEAGRDAVATERRRLGALLAAFPSNDGSTRERPA
ncbi:MAG TPA: helix-turn-helix transcriptional regulator [Vicinamibacterales bacterium]|jgi:DNA-binding PadR family transcriptional regulator|nr:helix-turn-helix transcriptional regulator [Vicinamibacterales bacterium]